MDVFVLSVVGWARPGYGVRRRRWRREDVDRSLGDSVAVVAGATGGIGEAAAAALARRGAAVYVLGHDAGRLEAALRRLRRHVPAADLRPALVDPGDLRQVAAFGRRLVARGEPVHVLVHNAGVPGGVDGHAGEQDLRDELVEACENVRSTFLA